MSIVLGQLHAWFARPLLYPRQQQTETKDGLEELRQPACNHIATEGPRRRNRARDFSDRSPHFTSRPRHGISNAFRSKDQPPRTSCTPRLSEIFGRKCAKPSPDKVWWRASPWVHDSRAPPSREPIRLFCPETSVDGQLHKAAMLAAVSRIDFGNAHFAFLKRTVRDSDWHFSTTCAIRIVRYFLQTARYFFR